MDYEGLLAYLDANWPKTTLTAPVNHFPFDRLRRLLEAFGSPQLDGEFVGVTGSKGKGSTARMVSEILQAHGSRVGLFCSPHLERVEERIQLDGSPIAPRLLAHRFGEALAARRMASLEDVGITPLLLALALAYFRDQRADVSVLEVRAGGRFDPTNVVDSRTICIGPIGLEHVPGLGYTLADIAWQKAGLLKPGAICFSALQPPQAEGVIEREAAALGTPLYRLGRELEYRVLARTEVDQTVWLRTPSSRFERVPLSMLGEHQAANAAIATAAAESVLSRQGRQLEAGALASALGRVSWPGRLERMSDTPLVLYDGAHTPESAAALAHALKDHFPGRRWTILLGVLSGKNAAQMLEQLQAAAARLHCVGVPGFSHYRPEDLAELATDLGFEATAGPSLAAALEAAVEFQEPICITGTLYLYEAARKALAALTN